MTYYIYTPMLVWAVTIEMQRTPLHEVGFASASWGGVPPPKDVVFVFWSWTSDPGGPVGPRPKGTPISEVYSIVVA